MSRWYRRCALAVVMVGAGLAVLIGFAGPSYVGNRRWGRLRRLVSSPAGLAEAIASLFIAPLVAVCILLYGVHRGQKWSNGEFDLMWVAGLVCVMTPLVLSAHSRATVEISYQIRDQPALPSVLLRSHRQHQRHLP